MVDVTVSRNIAMGGITEPIGEPAPVVIAGGKGLRYDVTTGNVTQQVTLLGDGFALSGGVLVTGMVRSIRVTTTTDGDSAMATQRIFADIDTSVADIAGTFGRADWYELPWLLSIAGFVPGVVEAFHNPANGQIQTILGSGFDDVLRPVLAMAVDVLDAGGNDTITGSRFDDRIAGVFGDDVIRAAAGHDTIFGGAGHDRLDGGAGDDRIEGGTGNDVLRGGDGHDRMSGGLGRDVLRAGSGDDLILSVGGTDLASGGPGADVFVFAPSGAAGGHRLIVADFTPGEDDLMLAGQTGTPAAILASFLDGARDRAAGLVWQDAAGNQIILTGVLRADLTEADFRPWADPAALMG